MRSLRLAMIGLRSPGAEGGVEQAVASLGPRLTRRGFAVTVFCRRGYPPGDLDDGMERIELFAPRSQRFEAPVHTGRSVVRALSGYDLVHLHAVGSALWSPLLAMFRVPTVLTVHGLDWRREKWGPAGRAALRIGGGLAGRLPDTLIAVSREIEAFYAGPRTVRIPNGVERPAFAPLEAAGIPHLSPGFLLSLSRIVLEKGIDRLIRAHALAGPGVPPLVIAGSPGFSDAILRELRGLVRSDVRFVGSVRGEAKSALLHHAGALVTASRIEGLPLSVLEAMACGIRVIASDIPPHRELLGKTLVIPDDQAWADAMKGWRNAAICSALPPEYDWERVADRTAAVYETVAARRGSGLR